MFHDEFQTTYKKVFGKEKAEKTSIDVYRIFSVQCNTRDVAYTLI